jgi:glycosyl transferase, family 25
LTENSLSVNVINLDRSQGRLEEFMRRNGSFADIERFPAIDGSRIDRSGLIDDGTISETLSYSNAHLGCAMSHITLWRRAVALQRPLTIAEDDAILSRCFRGEATRLLAERGWDIVMWGWNFDAFVWTEIPESVSRARLEFNQNDLRANIDAYRTAELRPTLLPLKHAFGIMTYTISPAGARFLLDTCLPIRDELISFGGYDVVIRNDSIDAAMNKAFPRMHAYLSLPPLAISENDPSTSINRGNTAG